MNTHSFTVVQYIKYDVYIRILPPPPQKKSPFFCAAFVFLPWNRRHWRNQGMTLALTVDKLYQLLIFSILLFSFHYFLKFFPNQVIKPCIYSHTYDLLFSYLIVIQSGSVSILWPNICPKSNDNNNCTLLLHTLKLQNNRKRDAMSMLLGIPPQDLCFKGVRWFSPLLINHLVAWEQSFRNGNKLLHPSPPCKISEGKKWLIAFDRNSKISAD